MISTISRELVGYSTPDERVLGIVLLDLIDDDYSYVIFARDEILRYRAIDVGVSHENYDLAHEAMFRAMRKAAERPDDAFHQGDTSGPPVDFFHPIIELERQNPVFSAVASGEVYSPAREIMRAMMRSFKDVDGNWIQTFQSAGFDARLWELYLWATFIELGYVRRDDTQVPDFILRGVRGSLAIEAATVNPPDSGQVFTPSNESEFRDYIENYLPLRLASAIKKKANRNPPYWEDKNLADIPFCIALQDFSGGGAMRFINPAIIEYAFGVRHTLIDGVTKIERIRSHHFGKRRAKSGFFFQNGSENISAIIVNPQGTLTKFGRLGLIAGFGNPNVQMIRTAILRRDAELKDRHPRKIVQAVDDSYEESWVEGMVVLHNPNAKIPLSPDLIPGAAHEFLQEDGTIQTLLPEFHPFTSETKVFLVS